MTQEAQDVTVEPAVDTAPIQDVKVEPAEEEVKETEAKTSPETEVKEAELTVEDKLKNAEAKQAGMQKAIDRKTADHHAMQRKLDGQRQELEAQAKLLVQQTPDKEPVLDDYESHDEYVDAVATFRAKALVTKERQNMIAEQQKANDQVVMNERIKLRHEQEATYMVDNPLYKTSVVEVDSYIKTLESTAPVQEAVIGQLYRGNVPEIINYFGSNNGENLSELGRISSLTPPEAAVEIYKIQQKLAATPSKKETKPKTTPVTTKKGGPRSDKSLAKSDGKEILDWVRG